MYENFIEIFRSSDLGSDFFQMFRFFNKLLMKVENINTLESVHLQVKV